jgi:UDP-N-acetylmuramoyl-tripeptide--D-alanyl-D-alanine ligase
VRTTIYGDRAETVAALLAVAVDPEIAGDIVVATTDSASHGAGHSTAHDDSHSHSPALELSDDLVVALRGMKSPAEVFSRAGAIIVSADEYELVIAAHASGKPVHTFGLTSAADFAASEIDATLTGTNFSLTHREDTHQVSLRLLGEHQVIGALATIAVASVSGVPIADAVVAVGTLAYAERWVMQPLITSRGAVVISMASSLKALALLTTGGLRSVAVLGAVDSSPADVLDDHDSIGRLVVRLNIKKLVVVGYAARHIQVAAGLEGSWDGESVLVHTPEEAYDLLSEDLGDGDVVLVKSSSAAGLRLFGDKLGGTSE